MHKQHFQVRSIIIRLMSALDLPVKVLDVCGDSALIIAQINGALRTRDLKHILYHEHLQQLIKRFLNISFIYLPRADNRFVDALAV